jgi:hypothetical protein
MMAPGGDLLVEAADRKGRRWRVGEALKGRPGVEVALIRTIGNFVQVDFRAGASARVPVIPPALVIHTGGIAVMRAASGSGE